LVGVELSEQLYRSMIGKHYAPFSFEICAARVRKYVELIGDTNPVHRDRDVARAAGFRNVTAPPTFGFTVALLAAQSDLALADLGVTVNETLHGEQRFDYFAPLCVGDVLTGHQWIDELKEKKSGTLLFLVTRFDIKNQFDELVLKMVQTSIVPLTRAPP
jgi:acyl dehydratase